MEDLTESQSTEEEAKESESHHVLIMYSSASAMLSMFSQAIFFGLILFSKRNLVRRLPFMRFIIPMSIADFGAAIGFLGLGIGNLRSFCTLQGFFLQFFTLVSFGYTAAIARAVYRFTRVIPVGQPPALDAGAEVRARYMSAHTFSHVERSSVFSVLLADWKTHLLCWVVPFLIAIFLWIDDAYGSTTVWCWVSRERAVERWLFLFTPLFIIIAFNMGCYILTGCRGLPSFDVMQFIGLHEKPGVYLIPFACTWGWVLVHGTAVVSGHGAAAEVFQAIHALLAPLIGLVDCVVYSFAIPAFRQEMAATSPVERESTREPLIQDEDHTTDRVWDDGLADATLSQQVSGNPYIAAAFGVSSDDLAAGVRVSSWDDVGWRENALRVIRLGFVFAAVGLLHGAAQHANEVSYAVFPAIFVLMVGSCLGFVLLGLTLLIVRFIRYRRHQSRSALDDASDFLSENEYTYARNTVRVWQFVPDVQPLKFLKRLLFMTLLQGVLPVLLVFIASKMIPKALTLALLSCAPLFAIIVKMAWRARRPLAFLPERDPLGRYYIALALGMLGAALISVPDVDKAWNGSSAASKPFGYRVLGLFLGLMAAGCSAVAAVYHEANLQKDSALPKSFWQTSMTAVLALLAAAVEAYTNDGYTNHWKYAMDGSTRVWLFVIFFGGVAYSAICVVLTYYLLNHITATKFCVVWLIAPITVVMFTNVDVQHHASSEEARMWRGVGVIVIIVALLLMGQPELFREFRLHRRAMSIGRRRQAKSESRQQEQQLTMPHSFHSGVPVEDAGLRFGGVEYVAAGSMQEPSVLARDTMLDGLDAE